MYSKTATTKSISSYWDNNTQVRRSMEKLKRKLENADAVVIGGGAGLSASAGFTYDNETVIKKMAAEQENMRIPSGLYTPP